MGTDRLPLALWDYGGDGPPVLFLHGFLDVGRSFEDVARAASAFCRPLCLDWRGHGSSGRCSPDAAYHQLDHLKDLAALLQECEQSAERPAALVAHSMGGTIALMLAGLLPEQVDRLLLLDNLGGYGATAAEQCDTLAKALRTTLAPKRPFRSFDSREAAVPVFRANNPGLSEEGARRIARHFLQARADGSFSPDADPRLRGPNPYRFPEEHWREICRRTAAQVLVLAPERGYLTDAAYVSHRARFDAFRSAEWRVVADASHHLHVDAPEAVVSALRDLLAVQIPAPG
ncbi:MAG: alpha/beta hydrolase [Planctomycetota bacterium]|nr:alpha/beta hydrolase [Planctomycetota bacterium]